MSIRVRNSGFGFVETMVSLVFLAVLSALAARFYAQVETKEEADLRHAREGVMLLNQALGAYCFDLGKPLPGKEQGGLQALVDEGYLEAVPKDPWGNTYRYVYPGVHSGRSFDLFSTGPDGRESEDDIVSWDLYGKPYRGT
ncbi:MAG TPA: hypothetical protein EYP34_11710, partial [Chromatiaceae bacterium]|nr:hypothetical protein [Chromatiaceae bacterium]